MFSSITFERRNAWWFALSAFIIVADQISKYIVIESLSLYQRVPLMPMLAFQRLHNTGAAFSFLGDAGGWQRCP